MHLGKWNSPWVRGVTSIVAPVVVAGMVMLVGVRVGIVAVIVLTRRTVAVVVSIVVSSLIVMSITAVIASTIIVATGVGIVTVRVVTMGVVTMRVVRPVLVPGDVTVTPKPLLGGLRDSASALIIAVPSLPAPSMRLRPGRSRREKIHRGRHRLRPGPNPRL